MRRRFLHVFLFFISLLTVTVSCRKEKMDEYYARPDWLAQPIYQQLQSGQYGQFSLFLNLIDKAGYKNVLDRAGYYTIFAPTDSAVQVYLNEKYNGSVNNVDSATAQKIVRYMLVYNAFKDDRIDDYQSTKDGWVANKAFKRRTVFYKGVYKDATLPSPYNSYLLVDNNRNLSVSVTDQAYSIDDNGNKYIPYFTQSFLNSAGLTSADYNYFYPDVQFTGFNVANAKVLKSNIQSENGYIHVVDKIIEPLDNMDEYLSKNLNKYSRFKEILDSFVYAYYPSEKSALKYERATGVKPLIYVKRFETDGPCFVPNNENWDVTEANDSQTDGRTLFVPDNNAMEDFLKTKFCKYYGSLGRMPKSIIYDMINSVMNQSTVWPNTLKSSGTNFFGERMSSIEQNITDKKILSNGIFYGMNKMFQSEIFYSVFGEVYLNPRYTIMNELIRQAEARAYLTSLNANYTVFMIPNDVFETAGYRYDPSQSKPWYKKGTDGVFSNANSEDVRKELIRIVNMHMVSTPGGELNDLAGAGTVKTFGNEVIKFNNNTIYAVGNCDTMGIVKKPVHVSTVDASPLNGKVYSVDNLLFFTSYKIRQFINADPDFSGFYTQLKKTSLMSGTTDLDNILLGSIENTIFIPTNEAIAADPVFTSGPAASVELLIKYHLVPKKAFIGDNGPAGTVSTALTIGIEPNKISVNNVKGNFTVTDEYGNVAHVLEGRSYVLANKTIVHLIDRVLKFKTK